MKVKDLLDKLSQLDPELKLVLSTEDEEIVASDELFKLFDIENVSVMDAEPVRSKDRKPTLSIGKSDQSEPIAIIKIVSDF